MLESKPFHMCEKRCEVDEVQVCSVGGKTSASGPALADDDVPLSQASTAPPPPQMSPELPDG